ncbi:tetratricopeptide repeat protein [Streptosporangium sp. G11]|uniref:tetratricopeptide repeat protein n=1 Tax=Streptosporangium sp. G11 TaxID=3436926 RepID=UPI003EBA42F8
MKVGRRVRWAMTGSGMLVPVAMGVATNRVEGPLWLQVIWFSTAVAIAGIGQLLARRAPESVSARSTPSRHSTARIDGPPNFHISVGYSESSSEGEVSRPVVVGEVPRQPPGFRSRADLISQLKQAASSEQPALICALIGTRGVGKTQVAAEYARWCVAQGWPLVAWVTAETHDQVLAGLDAVGSAIGVRYGEEDSRETAARVRNWLAAQQERCLLVFDNVPNAEVIQEWLPAVGKTQVVISSTRQSIENLGVAVPVGVFTEVEALTFLAERTGKQDTDGAARLASELDRLPLALAQAAWVIRQQGLTYHVYLERLKAVALDDFLKPIPGESYPHGAAQAVTISLGQIGGRRKAKLERAILDLLSVLSPAGVPRSWLHMAGELGLLGRSHRKGKSSAVQIDALVGMLADASLVVLSMDGQVIGMHRFIQRVIQDANRKNGDLPMIIRRAAKLIDKHAPALKRASLDRPEVEIFVEQSAVLWTNTHREVSSKNERQLGEFVLDLQNKAGEYLKEAGDIARAILLFEQNLSDLTGIIGSDNLDAFIIRSNLASVHQSAGRLDEAIALFELNLTDSMRVLGPDHRDVMASRNNLADAYRSAGRSDKAIALFELNLTEAIRVLGSDHVDILAGRGNLASAYQSVGRLDEAINLLESALVDTARVLGRESSENLVVRNNLASAYHQAGRFNEGIALLEQNLVDCARILGSDHPDTLANCNNLAGAYEAVGRLGEAIAMLEQNLASCKRVLGSDHPDVLINRSNLAGAYQASGRFDEAIALLEQNLVDCARILDSDHPDILTNCNNLAISYHSVGRFDEAIAMLEQNLHNSIRVLGSDHPDTIKTKANLKIARSRR